jgi:ABC-type enterochelin transport system ATPase subunit
LRLRLGAEVADDVVVMKFLRDGGVATRDKDWQNITEGSPGQRTAAMLGFVLHHGLEPLVLDQPEDDLHTEWISNLVVKERRASRWKQQIIVITHNANIPVNGDANQVVVLENVDQTLRIRTSEKDGKTIHYCGPIELLEVRNDIQNIMEGGIPATGRHNRRRRGGRH